MGQQQSSTPTVYEQTKPASRAPPVPSSLYDELQATCLRVQENEIGHTRAYLSDEAFQSLFHVAEAPQVSPVHSDTQWSKVHLLRGSAAVQQIPLKVKTTQLALPFPKETYTFHEFAAYTQREAQCCTGVFPGGVTPSDLAQPTSRLHGHLWHGFGVHVAPVLLVFYREHKEHACTLNVVMRDDAYSLPLVINKQEQPLTVHTLEDFMEQAFRFIAREEDIQQRNFLFRVYMEIVIHAVTQALLGIEACESIGIKHFGAFAKHVLLRNPTASEQQFSHFVYGVQTARGKDTFEPLVLRTSAAAAQVWLPVAELTDFRHALVEAETVAMRYDQGLTDEVKREHLVDLSRHEFHSQFDPVALSSDVHGRFSRLLAEHNLDYDDARRSTSAAFESNRIPGSERFAYSLLLMSNFSKMSEKTVFKKGTHGEKVMQHVVHTTPEGYAPGDVAAGSWTAGRALTEFDTKPPVHIVETKEVVVQNEEGDVLWMGEWSERMKFRYAYDPWRVRQKSAVGADAVMFVFRAIPFRTECLKEAEEKAQAEGRLAEPVMVQAASGQIVSTTEPAVQGGEVLQPVVTVTQGEGLPEAVMHERPAEQLQLQLQLPPPIEQQQQTVPLSAAPASTSGVTIEEVV